MRVLQADNWSNIFTNIDPKEDIFTIWFNKSNFQQNDLQKFFDIRPPNKYMLKPSRPAVMNWETIFDDYRLSVNQSQPWRTELAFKGMPGDFSRGYGASYIYVENGMPIAGNVFSMLWLKSEEDYRTASLLIGDADTIV